MIPEQGNKSYDYYKKRSVTGVKWSALTELVSRLFQFLVTVVLARILSPADFALITLSLILIKFVQLILDFGLTSALIQIPEIQPDDYRSSFTLLLALSGLFCGAIYFNPGFFARLIGEVKISGLIQYLTLIIPLNAFSIIPRVILMRHLEFKKISIVETISVIGYTGLTCIFAVLFRNVWCFVIGALGEQLLLTVVLILYSKWRPSFGFDWKRFKHLFTFSTQVFFTRLSNFLNTNILNILINKFFGGTVLGFFSLAYQIIDLPTQKIAKNIMKVMYPVLSQLQNRSEEYRELLLNYLFIILIFSLPFFLLLFVFAHPFITLVYGVKWLDSVPFLKILCIIGLVRTLWTAISVVSMSLGRPQFELYLNLVFGIILIPGLFFLYPQGVTWIIVYFTIILSLCFFYGMYKILNWQKISWHELFNKLRLPIFSNLILFILIISFQYLQIIDYQHSSPAYSLLAAGFFGFLYVLIIYLLDRRMFRQLARLVFQF